MSNHSIESIIRYLGGGAQGLIIESSNIHVKGDSTSLQLHIWVWDMKALNLVIREA